MFQDEPRKIGRPKLADTDLKRKSLLLVIVCFVMVLALLFTGAYKLNIIRFGKMSGNVTCGADDIPLPLRPYNAETNPEGLHEYGFTDPVFYTTVVNSMSNSSCSNVDASDLGNISQIIKSRSNVANTNGIQYLTGLIKIDLSSNNIENEVDLTHNTLLREINFYNNNISSIFFPETTTLTKINVTNNNILDIDLYKVPALLSLSASGNHLTNVDLSQNTEINVVDLTNNNISTITMTPSTVLSNFSIASNHLTTIDLSQNTGLQYVSLDYNELTSLTIPQGIDIKSLYLTRNKFTTLDLSSYGALEHVVISDNELTSLTLPENMSSVKVFQATKCYLQGTLDLSGATSLQSVNLDDNNLTSVVIPPSTSLTSFRMLRNKVTSLNFRSNTGLQSIAINDNLIDDLTLPESDSLKELYASGNKLGHIDLSRYTSLEKFSAVGSQLQSIVLPETNTLKTLDVSSNGITSLDLSHTPSLSSLRLSRINTLSRTYNIYSKSDAEIINTITTAYPDDTTYEIIDESIAKIENGRIVGLKPGTTTLNIKYKVSSSVNTTITHTINVVGLTSNDFNIDDEAGIISPKNDGVAFIDDLYDNIVIPEGHSIEINADDNELYLKDENNATVVTYELEGFVLFNLTTTNPNYEIDNDGKTINVNNNFDIFIDVSEFNVEPNTYTLSIDDEIEHLIVDSDTTNPVYYELTHVRRPVENAHKIAGFNDKEFYSFVSNQYMPGLNGRYVLTDDELETIDDILCPLTIVIEDLKGIEKLKNIRAFSLSNMVSTEFKSIDLSSNAKLTQFNLIVNLVENDFSINFGENDLYEQITIINYSGNNITLQNFDPSRYENLNSLELINVNINNIDISNNDELETLIIKKTKLNTIKFGDNSNLVELNLTNNKLKNIDLSNTSCVLDALSISHNELEKITFNNNFIGYIDLSYNNLTSLDLSNININYGDDFDDSVIYDFSNNKLNSIKLPNIKNNSASILMYNNDFDTLYVLKGKTTSYKNKVEVPFGTNMYDIDDTSIASYSDGVITGIKTGVATLYVTNERVYGFDSSNNEYGYERTSYYMKQTVKIYDVKSSDYLIDNDKKIIDVGDKDFDVSKIKVAPSGFKVIVKDNKVYIKDGDTLVDTYTLKNVKKVVKDTATSKEKDKKKNEEDMNQKLADKYDIDLTIGTLEIAGTKISIGDINKAVKERKNILAKDNDIEFLLSYYDLIKYHQEIDLSYILRDTKNKNFKDGKELIFNRKLPFNIKVSLKLNKKDLRVYDSKINMLNSESDNEKIIFTATKGSRKYYISNSYTGVSFIKKIKVNRNKTNLITIPLLAIILIIVLIVAKRRDKKKENE